MKNKTLKIFLIISLIIAMITLAVFLTYMVCDLANLDILKTITWALIVSISLLLIVNIVFVVLLAISLFTKREAKDEKQDDLKMCDMKFLAKYIVKEFKKCECPCCRENYKKLEGEPKHE